MSLRDINDLIGKWPTSLFPWRRIDDETLFGSDVLAVVQALSLSVVGIAYHLRSDWVILAMFTFMFALFFQVPLALGIAIAKLRAHWPPVGHAAMFAEPESIHDISWLRALRGGLLSAATTATFVLFVASDAPFRAT
jgi:hypothetical protein